ncbi:FAD-binding oxidoreductase [Rhodobacteraceae bacterium CCMM004]|nr:FAD-binding oxidoreductase [Rhodobacteraceae bacterium CCMM004]
MRWAEAEYAGWGRAVRATGRLARPERASALAAIMADAPAPAIGANRSYGDAALNDGGRAVLTTRLDRICGFDRDAGVIEAEAGVRLGDLLDAVAPHGWLPPVLPGTGHATLGGAVAMDVHGKNHHRDGSFGQHLDGLTLIQPGGTAVEVRPDTPLFAATVGGLGQTGAIERVRLRLTRTKGEVMIVTERRVPDWDAHLAALDGAAAPYTVGWIDATATGAALGRGIVEEGATGAGLVPPPRPARRVPLDAPGFALAPPVVRAFNAAYWRRVPASGRTVVRPLADFFFPLDRIGDWNRLYGRRGFHQFQCVVPTDRAPALRAMLEEVARSGLASPLAVLKRLGPGRAGTMSFPMEGWTLAVDLRNTPEAVRLAERLEAAAATAGGRIYLAKDALASGATIRAMYPAHAEWAAAADAADPDRTLVTDMVRRLGLRP